MLELKDVIEIGNEMFDLYMKKVVIDKMRSENRERGFSSVDYWEEVLFECYVGIMKGVSEGDLKVESEEVESELIDEFEKVNCKWNKLCEKEGIKVE